MATPEAPAAPRALPSSLAWAVIVPTACALGGWLAQYPYGLIVVGIVVGLAAAAAAAVTAGGFWHRPGAATIASLGGIALIFFAGPGLYQLYMATLGRFPPSSRKSRTGTIGAAPICSARWSRPPAATPCTRCPSSRTATTGSLPASASPCAPTRWAC
jgi:hypothetical protein